MYITTFDEIDFPAALSFLNLLLATHRHFCRVMGFEPNEPINSIAPGKAPPSIYFYRLNAAYRRLSEKRSEFV